MKKIFLILFASVLLFTPMAFVSAQGLGGALPALDKSLGTNKQGLAPDLSTGVGNIIGGALALVGTIFLILTVYGGITWMIAMGNSEKTEKAKEIITAAVIGLAITMGAYAITVFVTGRLQGSNQSCSDMGGACYELSSKEHGCYDVVGLTNAVSLSGTCAGAQVCCK